MCSFLYFLNTECQNMHSFIKVKTFLGSEDILDGHNSQPHNYKGGLLED